MTEYRRFNYSGATWFFTVNLTERQNNRLLIDRIYPKNWGTHVDVSGIDVRE